ncbi:hypothetical protein E4P38_03235 [Blastococcus sp. CT_GayMR16]|nr:hypothetical protein E4P38_03235 [Blastococcus sp. CT_GayMR16]
MSVKILNTFQGGLPPTDGVEAVTVPGAELAYMWISAGTPGDLSGSTVDKTVVGLDILAGGRRISLGAQLVPGSTGEQMARDLIASVVVG